MNVAFLQFTPDFGRISENLARIDSLAREGGGEADLLVLPELASTGYLFLSRDEVAQLAEPFPGGATASTYMALARDLQTVIVGGFAEREGDQLYNSSALVRPDGTYSVYRKTHLFLNEKDFFDCGNGPIEPSAAAGTSVGCMICFDWYFPEVCRLLALGGARIVCHPSNLVLPHAPESMRTRSIENRVFTITANRCGADERGGQRLEFIGMSQVVSPDGVVLARAPQKGDHLEMVSINAEDAAVKTITPKNDCLADRRKELYKGLV